MTKKNTAVSLLFLFLGLILLAGCGDTSRPPALHPANLNLIFVVSQDLTYNAPGDFDATTANLTSQGLQRSLLMAPYLQQQVLGSENVTNIYALEPMTHLQTANDYPDLAPLETIQEFAMMNRAGVSYQGTVTSAQSYPVFAGYSSYLPPGVASPVLNCPQCQGLDFTDHNGDNETLVSGIIDAKTPGFYVFSAPWETVNALLTNISQVKGYNLPLPPSYVSPNLIYAISITPAGIASFTTYNSDVTPPSSYPQLPAGAIVSAACTGSYHVQITNGVGGAVVPANHNVNETVYMIRHAEAHPVANWDEGNYVGAGHWRALDLPAALAGKIQPSEVYSIDPANSIPVGIDGTLPASYVRPTLTAAPYAIANHLPFHLAAGIAVFDPNASTLAFPTSDFFFTGGAFSNKTILVAWEHDHIPPTINALLTNYAVTPNAPTWSDTDYDTIWSVTLDASGNLTLDNRSCEGIDSSKLPAMPPEF
jgi:hypothetical protein